LNGNEKSITNRLDQQNDVNMVLGLLVIAGIPTTIGVAEAVSAQKKQNAAEKEKAKFQMMVKLSIDQGPAEDCWVVLVGGKVRFHHWWA